MNTSTLQVRFLTKTFTHVSCLVYRTVIFLFLAGVVFVMPCIDKVQKVDLRIRAFNVPPQHVSIVFFIQEAH